MEPTKELIDPIYAEKVRRARQTPIEEKLMAGPQLFAYGCEAMRAGIRAQHPALPRRKSRSFSANVWQLAGELRNNHVDGQNPLIYCHRS